MRHGLTVSSQTRPIPCASTGHLSRDCRLVIGTAKFFLVPAAVALAGLRDIRAGGIPLSWVGQARVINRRKIERDLAEFIGNRMGCVSGEPQPGYLSDMCLSACGRYAHSVTATSLQELNRFF